MSARKDRNMAIANLRFVKEKEFSKEYILLVLDIVKYKIRQHELANRTSGVCGTLFHTFIEETSKTGSSTGAASSYLVESYRVVANAETYVFGYIDHPYFNGYPLCKKVGVRLHKIDVFRNFIEDVYDNL